MLNVITISVVMLNVVMLNVVVLNVIVLNVVMLNVSVSLLLHFLSYRVNFILALENISALNISFSKF